MQAVQEVEELRQAAAAAERDRAALGSAKSRLAVAERQCKALEWENEVVTQRLEAVGRGLAMRVGWEWGWGWGWQWKELEWENEVVTQRLEAVG